MLRRHIGLCILAILATAAPAAAAPEGTLTFALHYSLPSLDPADAESIITPYLTLYAIHDAMLKPMPGNPSAPSLAESWSMTKDGLSAEFTLRKGPKFHNGDPVTAEDVKFSFERYRGGGAKILKSKVKEIVILSPTAAPVRLQGAVAGFPRLLRHDGHRRGMDRAEEVRRARRRRRLQEGADRRRPVQVRELRAGVELVLEAFDGYWRKPPSIKRLVFRIMPDETTRAAALKRGEVDVAFLVSGPIGEELRRTPGLRLVAPLLGIFWLDFPEQWDPKSPWADRRVRMAASLAIDRQGLNQAETLGLSRPSAASSRASSSSRCRSSRPRSIRRRQSSSSRRPATRTASTRATSHRSRPTTRWARRSAGGFRPSAFGRACASWSARRS